MAITDETQASNRLSERLRSGLALAQTRIQTMESRAKTQWTDLPVQLRGVVDRAVARLRDTLDLPSRSEVSDLVERLEALDRKIGALEKRQGKRAAASDVAAQERSAEASGQGEAVEVEAQAQAQAPVVEESAKAGAETMARKTVKSTSAGKTVKAGRSSENRGSGSGSGGQTRGRKKGRR